MKKILKMMSVLLALGMLFAGCAQSTGGSSGNNTNGNSNSGGSNNTDDNGNNGKSLLDGKIEATAADFDGDTSWLIGTWKCTEVKAEVTFEEGCTLTPEQQKYIVETAGAQYKQMLDVQKGTKLELDAGRKDNYLSMWKNQLKSGSYKYYSNEEKTELIQVQIVKNEEIKLTTKLIYVYTKQ